MWTSENRARYDRDELRYPSDVTDAEWALIEPLIPAAKRGGRRRKTDMRQTFNAVMYLLSTGCQWRYLPKDFPPQGTVRRYFDAWSWRGGLGRMHDALYEFCRAQEGREASPTAAIIDSQSVKSAEKGGVSIDPHGFDAGKKIKGKKRHILVDTRGLLLIAIVHSAGIQDRDGGVRNLAQSPHRNCKAIGSRERLRDPAEALDRRKVNRLVEPLSQARQGLGKSEPNRSGISPFCFDPAHATKALQSFLNFRIGL